MSQPKRLSLKPSQTMGQTVPVEILPNLTCGDRDLWIVAGPCAVESAMQLEQVAECLNKNSVKAIRGGAFKPRTSPYSFQGLEKEGLLLLNHLRQSHRLATVSEVMAESHLEDALQTIDVLQVGSRNMQNFSLLKALGETQKPVLLKRGLSATIDELLWAAEYIMAGGNHRVILCERGIRSFDSNTRNVLDLGAVAVLKELTHLPVMVDPSHAAGRRDIITALSKAAIAAGADGLLIEIHPDPDRSVSDADQALSFSQFESLMTAIRPVAEAVGRRLNKTKELVVMH